MGGFPYGDIEKKSGGRGGISRGGGVKGIQEGGRACAKARREKHGTFLSESEGARCPSTYCVTSRKSHHVPEPQYPHLSNGPKSPAPSHYFCRMGYGNLKIQSGKGDPGMSPSHHSACMLLMATGHVPTASRRPCFFSKAFALME